MITSGGGSQRLAHAVSKSCTMELVVTGRMWSAQDAAAWGMWASRMLMVTFAFRLVLLSYPSPHHTSLISTLTWFTTSTLTSMSMPMTTTTSASPTSVSPTSPTWALMQNSELNHLVLITLNSSKALNTLGGGVHTHSLTFPFKSQDNVDGWNASWQ